jgi:alkaline phosphatase D
MAEPREDDDQGGSYLGLASLLVVILGSLTLLVWAGIAPLRKTQEAGRQVPPALTELQPGNPPAGPAAPAWPRLSASTVLTRIAVGSGLDQRQPMPILQTILARKPQALILAGNAIDVDIKDPSTGKLMSTGLLIASAYGALDANLDFRVLKDSIPIYGVWGHRDCGLGGAGEELAIRAASKEAFLQFYGVSEGAARARRDGVYDALAFGPEGQRVQIILLDTQSFRSPLKPASGNAGEVRSQPDGDVKKTMLGDEQWRWLEQQLIEPADVRLIVSPIAVLSQAAGGARWNALPKERERLIEVLRRTGAQGAVLVSGDEGAAAVYKDDKALSYPLYELTPAALNAAAPAAAPDEPDAARTDKLYRGDNFGIVEIDWQARAVNLELRAKTGDLLQGISMPLAAAEGD